MKIEFIIRDTEACEKDSRWLGNNCCHGDCSKCKNITLIYDNGYSEIASESTVISEGGGIYEEEDELEYEDWLDY